MSLPTITFGNKRNKRGLRIGTCSTQDATASPCSPHFTISTPDNASNVTVTVTADQNPITPTSSSIHFHFKTQRSLSVEDSSVDARRIPSPSRPFFAKFSRANRKGSLASPDKQDQACQTDDILEIRNVDKAERAEISPVRPGQLGHLRSTSFSHSRSRSQSCASKVAPNPIVVPKRKNGTATAYNGDEANFSLPLPSLKNCASTSDLADEKPDLPESVRPVRSPSPDHAITQYSNRFSGGSSFQGTEGSDAVLSPNLPECDSAPQSALFQPVHVTSFKHARPFLRPTSALLPIDKNLQAKDPSPSYDPVLTASPPSISTPAGEQSTFIIWDNFSFIPPAVSNLQVLTPITVSATPAGRPDLSVSVLPPSPSVPAPPLSAEPQLLRAPSLTKHKTSRSMSDSQTSHDTTSLVWPAPKPEVRAVEFPWHGIPVHELEEFSTSENVQKCIVQAMRRLKDHPLALVIESAETMAEGLQKAQTALMDTRARCDGAKRRRDALLKLHFSLPTASEDYQSVLDAISRVDTLTAEGAYLQDYILRLEQLMFQHDITAASLSLSKLNASYLKTKDKNRTLAKDLKAARQENKLLPTPAEQAPTPTSLPSLSHSPATSISTLTHSPSTSLSSAFAIPSEDMVEILASSPTLPAWPRRPSIRSRKGTLDDEISQAMVSSGIFEGSSPYLRPDSAVSFASQRSSISSSTSMASDSYQFPPRSASRQFKRLVLPEVYRDDKMLRSRSASEPAINLLANGSDFYEPNRVRLTSHRQRPSLASPISPIWEDDDEEVARKRRLRASVASLLQEVGSMPLTEIQEHLVEIMR